MKTYNATATREGRWWIVDVPDIGVTQGRTTREAERMAADLVAIMLDIPVEQVTVNVTFRLSDELTNEVHIARQAQKQQTRRSDMPPTNPARPSATYSPPGYRNRTPRVS